MLSQSFGDISEEAANEADTVTTVEFDEDGQNLATGDRGGRIVVFKYAGNTKKVARRPSGGPSNLSQNSTSETHLWSPFFQFQSHEVEFDYLKSIEIEERVNQIRFCKPVCGKIFLLSTNDKTIKLWKVADRPQYTSDAYNCVRHRGVKSIRDVPLPKPKNTKNEIGISNSTIAVPRKVYEHAHAYHINSLSMNSDGETFLSSDDLAINLWNLERSDCSLNILDIKPSMMEELSEVITCSLFHPSHCNILAYSTSKGIINQCDLRVSSLMDSTIPASGKPRPNSPIRSFTAEDDSTFKSSFSEALSSISNIKYTKDGRYIVSRDYLTVKIWDVNMESRPVVTIPVHDHLRSMLPSLYESDSIFDKFEVFVSPSSDRVVTGTYNNQYSIFKMDGQLESTVQIPSRQQADNAPQTALVYPNSFDSVTISDTIINGANELISGLKNLKLGGIIRLGNTQAEPVRVDQKIMHGSWHPSLNVMAIAGQTGLYMYKI